MAIWKEQTLSKNDSTAIPQSTTTPLQLDDTPVAPPVNTSSSHRSNGTAAKESLIAADLTIEGKIQGAGHVRMAGQFKGDVHVDGNLTIEPGAKVIGSVRARTVVIGGELEGNIESASHVELLATGVLTGDLQAGSLVVAGGSRMRGQVSFGWDDGSATLRSATFKSPKLETLPAS